jgi:hypothetical protein
MMTRLTLILLLLGPGIVHAQSAPIPIPDECYGFKFGGWEPPLKSVASTYNPGYDPKTSAPPGAPRDWAARVATGRSSTVAPDSVLLLFPAWWPAGVSIDWLEQRGDTLLGRAVALVADGRVKNPVSSVRGVRVACRRPYPRGDTTRGGPS